MSYKIEYTKTADESLAKFKKSNPMAAKKILKFLEELAEHPRTGTGHPEPLTKGSLISYSRRITKKDRLIYDVYDDRVLVLIIDVEGHYNDK